MGDRLRPWVRNWEPTKASMGLSPFATSGVGSAGATRGWKAQCCRAASENAAAGAAALFQPPNSTPAATQAGQIQFPKVCGRGIIAWCGSPGGETIALLCALLWLLFPRGVSLATRICLPPPTRWPPRGKPTGRSNLRVARSRRGGMPVFGRPVFSGPPAGQLERRPFLAEAWQRVGKEKGFAGKGKPI